MPRGRERILDGGANGKPMADPANVPPTDVHPSLDVQPSPNPSPPSDLNAQPG